MIGTKSFAFGNELLNFNATGREDAMPFLHYKMKVAVATVNTNTLSDYGAPSTSDDDGAMQCLY